jgi:hypothetical protein
MLIRSTFEVLFLFLACLIQTPAVAHNAVRLALVPHFPRFTSHKGPWISPIDNSSSLDSCQEVGC